jgi:hypothetical protein
MNSDVHPAVAAIVLIATVMAIALWTWGSGVAASFGGPAELKTGPNGHSYVQIQNYLVEHDADGAYLRAHDLDALNVQLFLGGYAFFSNGDILLRRGEDPRTFLDNFRAYKRETNSNSIVPSDPGSGLSRCNLETSVCEPFGESSIDFKAAYSVFIDWPTDEVYISDTTRHLLRKYSSRGVELASPVGGFKFPNQLSLHDGQLLVVDTNNHVIRVLESKTAAFADPIDSKDVVPGAAELAEQTWPSHFARVDDEWWVNNMQTGMDRGGIYVFDNDWQYLRRVELPQDADPISILAVGDTVWVSDWTNDVVRRFSTRGQPLANLESDGLKKVLTLSRQERRKYIMLSYSGIAAFLAILFGLMVRAFALSMNKDPVRKSAEDNAADTGTDTVPLHLEPDAKVRKRMTTAIRLVTVLSLLIIIPLIFMFGILDHPELVSKLIGPIAGMFAIVMLIAWINKANWGTAIAVDGNMLTLRDHTGRMSTCPIRQVRYDNTAIATRDAVVILGRPKARIFAEADIHEQLMPRLSDAQRVGAIEMLKIQIQLRHPQGIVAVLALIGVLAYAVVRLVS